jgi:hypothetical protein
MQERVHKPKKLWGGMQMRVDAYARAIGTSDYPVPRRDLLASKTYASKSSSLGQYEENLHYARGGEHIHRYTLTPNSKGRDKELGRLLGSDFPMIFFISDSKPEQIAKLAEVIGAAFYSKNKAIIKKDKNKAEELRKQLLDRFSDQKYSSLRRHLDKMNMYSPPDRKTMATLSEYRGEVANETYSSLVRRMLEENFREINRHDQEKNIVGRPGPDIVFEE